MATATEIITRAARKRLRESGLALTSDELTDGLADLNDMLAQWAVDGIDLAHTELAATDTLDVPADHIQAIVLNLAIRLTDFGGQIDQFDIIQAERARDALLAYHFTIGDLANDNPLSRNNLSAHD